MEVSARYQLVSKCTLSCISMNPQLPLLALTADGNDTATFFTPTPDMSLQPKFISESRPPSSSCIIWSPSGKYVGVASTKVEIWKLDNMKLSPYVSFAEGMVEIKNLAWAPDSKSYLVNGINPKSQKISIKIRNIETKEAKQIFPQQPIIAASFDPFGKYIVALLKNNSLEVFDSQTLEPIKTISMAFSKNDPSPFKEHRMIDWSPDFGFLIVPNLNQIKCPMAVLFDRHSNFKIKTIFKGHTAPINCVKFNPIIFEFQGKLTFIVAIGDSSGCISVWRIERGTHINENQLHLPLFIASSCIQAEQCIEHIQWSKSGTQLYANPLKKYLIQLTFKLSDFGRPLSEQEKSNLILGMYGASGAGEITGSKLQVFGLDRRVSMEQRSNTKIDQKIELNDLPMIQNQFMSKPLDRPQEMVKTKQQVIINKTNNKKRIVPSMMVPASVVQSQSQINNNISNNFNISHSQLVKFKLPILKQQLRRQYNINGKRKLIYKIQGPLRTLTIIGDCIQKRRVFPSDITDLRFLKKQILVIYSQRLLIFNLQLDLICLPILIGDISLWTANNQGVFFYLQSNGIIRGFNFKSKHFIIQTSLAYLCPSPTQQDEQLTQLPIRWMRTYENDGEKVHVEIQSTGSKYFFCKQTQSWAQLNFNNGLFRQGHSLRVNRLEEMNSQKFFNSLVKNQAPILKNDAKFKQFLNPYELELVYYGHYEPNQSKYKETLIKMISQVKASGVDEQLRKLINRFFLDKKSPDYQRDRTVWQRVQAMGGRIIEQFIMLGLE